MPQRLWTVGLSSLLAAACSSSGGGTTQPPLPPCAATSSGQVSLGVAAYTVVDPTQTAGCAVFPANPSAATIEYVVVPQSASSVPDDSGGFKLSGNPLAAPPAPGVAAAGSVPLTTAQQFDATLRRAERELAIRQGAPAPPRAAAPVSAGPPAVGDRRTFKVCGNLDCSSHPTVVAFARKVGAHIAVFQDSSDEANGRTLSTFDLDTLATLFDTLLYAADTSAFGRESDIDVNGVVIVLMTGKVNSLVPSPCTGGFVAGYFYGGDLVAGFGNSAEIFYSMVPDPNMTLSCLHTANGVKHTVPGTFIHEFQHMISFNQHYLRHNGTTPPEDLWLNEGLSHYAEELGARLFLPADSTTFCYFIFGDLYNSNQYFANPQSYFLVDTIGIGGLANRGAYWLFVRFVVDQFSSDTSRAANNVVTRALDQTSLTGAVNVANVTGTSFATVVERWALANYVSDLAGGFTTPPELQYNKWRFRTDYATTHNICFARTNSMNFPASFPLVPLVLNGSSAQLSGVLHAGSGSYYRVQQAAGAPGFSFLFSNPSGRALRASLVPRLNVIRIQ